MPNIESIPNASAKQGIRYPAGISITVAVCVYNTRASLLRDCFNSINAQDYDNYDTVIVDNASTSAETIKEIERFLSVSEKPVRWLRKQENRGLHDSRSVAIQNCSGSHIAFVDSDDLISPNYLSELAKAALIGTGPCVAKCSFVRFSQTPKFETIQQKALPLSSEEAIRLLLTEKIMPSVWGTLFPVECFQGFQCLEENGVDDMQMNLYALGLCQSFVQCHSSIYGWRNADGSGMKSSAFLHLVDFSLERWLDYASVHSKPAVPYLRFRVSVSKLKCLVVDQYGTVRWKDFKMLSSPYFHVMSKALKNKTENLYLSRKQRALYRLICLFPHIYCWAYYRHRAKAYSK